MEVVNEIIEELKDQRLPGDPLDFIACYEHIAREIIEPRVSKLVQERDQYKNWLAEKNTERDELVDKLADDTDELESLRAQLNAAQYQKEVATVRVTNNGYGMVLSTHVAYALPEGDHKLYAAPVPVQQNNKKIAQLIESVRKWGIDHTGCEPSISCFNQAVDELRMYLENPSPIELHITNEDAEK